LFNYLFAKKHGGQFKLRIEDTDKARSTAEATQAILDGMAWMELPHDGDVVYQSKNAQNHIDAANAMIASGHAYRCYLSAEDQDSLKLVARDEGRAFRSPWRDLGPSDYPATGAYVVRFKVPEGETKITDSVQGEITWDNKNFDDLILLRADGSPVYMLAVVVDDHDMGVTHVIRGDDHLINAGRQTLIYRALGWAVPMFAHVPLIHGPDGKKLSKRHGALEISLEALQDTQWQSEPLQACLTDFAARNDVGFGKIGQPLRMALTGGAPSPDLSVVLARLGKAETLARLADVLSAT